MNDNENVELLTGNGQSLLVTAAARAHLQAHPTVGSVLEEAVARLTLPEVNSLTGFEVDLHRPLQLATALPTPRIDADTRDSFALRINRAYPSRVTHETPTVWESTVVIWVKRSDDGSRLELATAYIGKLAPFEPWAPQLRSQAQFQTALDFWCRNALVYDAQVMQRPFTTTWREILQEAQSPFLAALTRGT